MSQMPDDYDDEAVIMGGGHSVKAPWADVIEEIEFDWRQVP